MAPRSLSRRAKRSRKGRQNAGIEAEPSFGQHREYESFTHGLSRSAHTGDMGDILFRRHKLHMVGGRRVYPESEGRTSVANREGRQNAGIEMESSTRFHREKSYLCQVQIRFRFRVDRRLYTGKMKRSRGACLNRDVHSVDMIRSS